MTMRVRPVPVFLALLSLAASAWFALPVTRAAGTDAGTWEFGAFVGYDFLDHYAGLEPKNHVLYGARAGYFFTPAWSAEVSYHQLSTKTDLDAPATNSRFRLQAPRLNVLYNFLPGKTLQPFLTGGVGYDRTKVRHMIDVNDASLNAGGGVRWALGQCLALRADTRYVYSRVGRPVGQSQGNIETTAGLSFFFGGGAPKDSDGDGVPDSRDACPNTPRGAIVNDRGCPKDSDKDGVFDGPDLCPDTPSGCPVDAKGCPLDSDGDSVIDCRDTCPSTPKGAVVDAKGCPKDADGDGVFDGIDRCPDTPKGAAVDATGCPHDVDGDGVYDGLDRCPDTAHGCHVDANGCSKDEDRDGVCDGIDRCPGTPAGHKVDAKGCELVFNERGTLRLEGVNFATDSDRLTPDSTRILDGVAASLKEWSDLHVEVGGHTDASGKHTHNMDLSRRRAKSVRDYLAGKGVAASRLTAKGYGETIPLADNKTAEGRARNRRVELKKVE